LSDQPRPRSRRRWLIAAALIVVVIGVFIGWRHERDAAAKADAANKPPQRIPVTVAQVTKADFPVYLYGLGTVEPYDTVTVRSRVDGQVVSVDFKQGQIVQQDALLVQIDPRPYQAALDQVVAKKAQDEASLRNAQLNLARYGALAKEDFASQQQFNTQQATVQQLTAQIQGDQAAIDNAQTQLSYTTIRSPLTGRVGFRFIDPGNIVNASATTGIATVVKLQPISVVFTAPEEDVVDISDALGRGTVPVNALSSDGTKVLSQGHLALLNNTVDQASGTISMKATFANTDNALWPGLSVSTRLLLDTLQQVVVVPEGAIGHGPDGLFAFVVGPDDKLKMQPIKISHQGENEAVISEGLSPGETIVTSGQYELSPGALVDPHQAEPAAPAQPEPATPPPASNATAQAPNATAPAPTATAQVPNATAQAR
jgi:multidrug efflux system membrane fusion protein